MDLHEAPTSHGKVRVLHVDDDRPILDLTSAFLDSELDSVSVTTVTNPEEALSRLEAGRFNCVISDYDMLETNGLELFETIREEHPILPFVLYTGKGSEEIASRAVNAGVTGYFQKGGPEQQRRLANRVEQAVGEYQTKIEAERYSTVLRALDYPIYVVDETGVFSYVNDAFLEMTGYDREAIIGSKTDIIKGNDAVAEAENRLGTILSDEGPEAVQFPVDIVPKEGDPIPCRDHMAVLPYEGEEFRGSVGILRNVCSERRREIELERMARTINEAPIGIVRTDPSRKDNPMTYVNDRFTEVTGYDREEAVGRNCRFLQGPETRSEPVAELRQAINAGEPATVELRDYRKNGEHFWNRITISPIHDESGEIDRWIGFQRDITEYKQREQELKRQNERLEQFASIVSHDLRSPISVATGRIELAKGQLSNGDENLDDALDALDRMETIVEKALTLAQEGETIGEHEAISIASAAEKSWRTSETEDAALETDTDIEVCADGDRLRTLLQNLFVNAVQHGSSGNPTDPGDAAGDGGPGTQIRLGAIEGGFYVADDGPGIPDDEREAIFEPGHTTAEGGTGFGLAIVKEIAEAHGWTIDVTESDSGGARFEVSGVRTIE